MSSQVDLIEIPQPARLYARQLQAGHLDVLHSNPHEQVTIHNRGDRHMHLLPRQPAASECRVDVCMACRFALSGVNSQRRACRRRIPRR